LCCLRVWLRASANLSRANFESILIPEKPSRRMLPPRRALVTTITYPRWKEDDPDGYDRNF
jgi:hypothetical protein